MRRQGLSFNSRTSSILKPSTMGTPSRLHPLAVTGALQRREHFFEFRFHRRSFSFTTKITKVRRIFLTFVIFASFVVKIIFFYRVHR